MPLKFTLTPAGGGAAVVDAGFTQVSFAKPAASTFDFTPPKGAKVTEEKDKADKRGERSHEMAPSQKDLGKSGAPKVIGKAGTRSRSSTPAPRAASRRPPARGT